MLLEVFKWMTRLHKNEEKRDEKRLNWSESGIAV